MQTNKLASTIKFFANHLRLTKVITYEQYGAVCALLDLLGLVEQKKDFKVKWYYNNTMDVQIE